MYNIHEIIIKITRVAQKECFMENYVVAELEVVAVATADTISSSFQIPSGENELPID